MQVIKDKNELFEEILDLLYLALPYVEDAVNDPVNKPEPVRMLVRRIRATLERAENSEG